MLTELQRRIFQELSPTTRHLRPTRLELLQPLPLESLAPNLEENHTALGALKLRLAEQLALVARVVWVKICLLVVVMHLLELQGRENHTALGALKA